MVCNMIYVNTSLLAATAAKNLSGFIKKQTELAGGVTFEHRTLDDFYKQGAGIMWIKIEDEIPELDEEVIVHSKEYTFEYNGKEYVSEETVCSAWLGSDKLTFYANLPYDAPIKISGVTHWMRLPKWPAEE